MKTIKRHVCKDEKTLFSLVGGIRGALFKVYGAPYSIATMRESGNDCVIYRNDEGFICVDEEREVCNEKSANCN